MATYREGDDKVENKTRNINAKQKYWQLSYNLYFIYYDPD
jgi:hypothetical protein